MSAWFFKKYPKLVWIWCHCSLPIDWSPSFIKFVKYLYACILAGLLSICSLVGLSSLQFNNKTYLNACSLVVFSSVCLFVWPRRCLYACSLVGFFCIWVWFSRVSQDKTDCMPARCIYFTTATWLWHAELSWKTERNWYSVTHLHVSSLSVVFCLSHSYSTPLPNELSHVEGVKTRVFLL